MIWKKMGLYALAYGIAALALATFLLPDSPRLNIGVVQAAPQKEVAKLPLAMTAEIATPEQSEQREQPQQPQ